MQQRPTEMDIAIRELVRREVRRSLLLGGLTLACAVTTVLAFGFAPRVNAEESKEEGKASWDHEALRVRSLRVGELHIEDSTGSTIGVLGTRNGGAFLELTNGSKVGRVSIFGGGSESTFRGAGIDVLGASDGPAIRLAVGKTASEAGVIEISEPFVEPTGQHPPSLTLGLREGTGGIVVHDENGKVAARFP